MSGEPSSPSRFALPEWEAVADHARATGQLSLRELFAADHRRSERLSFEACGLFVDHSKQRLTEGTLPLLVRLAEACGLRERIDAMFAGERINATEHRAVLHVALRAPRGETIEFAGEDVVPGVHEVLDRMAAFCDRVRKGEWLGHTGKRIRTIVNIGIGGSDLGPVMASTALRHYADRELTFRFVSNVDGTDFAEAVHDLDPAENALNLLKTLLHAIARTRGALVMERRRVDRLHREFCMRAQRINHRILVVDFVVSIRVEHHVHGPGRRIEPPEQLRMVKFGEVFFHAPESAPSGGRSQFANRGRG